MKKLFTLALAAALVCFTVLPVGAAAKPVSELCEYSGSPDSFWVTENYDGAAPKTRAKAASGLPETFDLRNASGVSFVSSVKNQGNTNSCWAFTSLSCLETFLRRKTFESSGELIGYDFSERHL